MQITLPSRGALLIGGGFLLALGLWLGLPFLSPSRGVERAWDQVLEAISENDPEELGRLLGADYSDGFGFDRAEAIRVAGLIRAQFLTCTFRRERSEVVMDPSKKSAVTRAKMRLVGTGSPIAQGAIQASAVSESLTSFRWRRNSWRPWDWRLVSIENPDAVRALTRFQREAGAVGLF